MKNLKKIIGIVLVIFLMCSIIGCGTENAEGTVSEEYKSTARDDGVTDGYILRRSEEDKLGTPEKALNAQDVYRSLTYTPEMFYGTYRLLGGDAAVEQYGKQMDYMEYNGEKLTVLPYKLVTGKENMRHSINYAKDHSWTKAYFRTEAGNMSDLICAYEIEGTTITLKPLKNWESDKENNTIRYSFSGEAFTYEFSFCGLDLTLSKDGKSVTMRTGLGVMTDDINLRVGSYISPASDKLDDMDYIGIRYSGEENDSYVYLENIAAKEQEYHAVAKLSNDGLFTLSIPKDDGAKTYQLVYFYCEWDGIVLTDGTTTYYYNDTRSDYYKINLSNYLAVEDGEKIDSLSDSQLEAIAEKKENLLGDLVTAFEAAGIKVTVNEATGELAMDASVLFGGDSAVLTDAGKDFLNKFIGAYTDIVFGEKYKGFVSKTMIEGHTAPLTGSTYESGLPLSEERANAVKNYCLSAESGVDPAYISELTATMEAVGMSNTTPVYDQDGNVDPEASRRVSFRFIINID